MASAWGKSFGLAFGLAWGVVAGKQEFPPGRVRRHAALPPYMPPIPLIRPRLVEDDEAFLIATLL